jgi:hypothetical protein
MRRTRFSLSDRLEVVKDFPFPTLRTTRWRTPCDAEEATCRRTVARYHSFTAVISGTSQPAASSPYTQVWGAYYRSHCMAIQNLKNNLRKINSCCRVLTSAFRSVNICIQLLWNGILFPKRKKTHFLYGFKPTAPRRPLLAAEFRYSRRWKPNCAVLDASLNDGFKRT